MEGAEPRRAGKRPLTHGAPPHGPHKHQAGSSRHTQDPGPGYTLSSSGDGHSCWYSLVSPQCGSPLRANPVEMEREGEMCYFFRSRSLTGCRLGSPRVGRFPDTQLTWYNFMLSTGCGSGNKVRSSRTLSWAPMRTARWRWPSSRRQAKGEKMA